MLFLKRYTAVFLSLLFFISNGCKKQDEPYSYDASIEYEDVVCPLLYQENDSLVNALKFVEAPEEKYESYISSIQKYGDLVSGDLLKVANKYLSLSTNKNPELFISMLSEKTKDILNDDSKNGYLLRRINQIKEGTLFNSEEEYKYLAVSSAVSQELKDTLKKANFTQMPTHRIFFYNFYRPKYRLIGSSVYFIEEKGSYKIISETMSKDSLKSAVKPKSDSQPKEYGISSFEQNDNAYNEIIGWKYIYEIAVSPDDTENNTFEMLKLTEIISEQDNNDILPDIAREVLVGNEKYEKYKNKKLNFRFCIGNKEPEHNYSKYGQKLSGWSFGFFMANYSTSSTLFYIGQDVLNIQINKNGYFIDSDLELMSFESEQDDVRYKNRVLLRKTPIDGKSTD
jgi:hypothetical protein